MKKYGKIDILVNNAAVQYECTDIKQLTDEQFDKTMKTNVYGTFYMTREAMKYLKSGGCIINTTSVTAFHGNETLIDYSMTKGAVLTLTRSLSMALTKGKTGIRVNSVAPGPNGLLLYLLVLALIKYHSLVIIHRWVERVSQLNVLERMYF